MIEIITAIIILVIAIPAAFTAFRLINESVESVTVWDYQTGLHFRHGRFVETLDAGKHRLWGRGHTVFLYDTRITELVVASQEVITADSATLKLSAVAQWKIADALKYHEAAQDPNQALYTRIQLALRQVIGGLELDAIIERKATFVDALLERVRDTALNDFGMKVEAIDAAISRASTPECSTPARKPRPSRNAPAATPPPCAPSRTRPVSSRTIPNSSACSTWKL